MAQYLLLIHGNTEARPAAEDWERFFAAARRSGFFVGGSAIGDRLIIGRPTELSAQIAGYMRFDADDRRALEELLKDHPVVRHGGSVELCEMPKT